MELNYQSTNSAFPLNASQEDSELFQKEESQVLNTSTHAYHPGELLNESWWNVFDEKFLRHDTNRTIALVVVYMLILVSGVIANSTVIVVLVLRPKMRSVGNILVMNLAVADLFVSLFCVVPTLLSNIFKPWILGSFMCKGLAYMQGVSVCASVYSLAFISVHRFQAICKLYSRRYNLSKGRALKVICGIWIVGLLMTIPWAVIFDVIIHKDDGFPYCVETWENEFHGKLYFLAANLLFCYGVPIALIAVSNFMLYGYVRHRQVPQNSAFSAPIIKMHKETRQRVMKTVGIVTISFVISWMPLYIIVSRMKFSEEIGDWESSVLDKLFPFAQWLGSCNCIVNPIVNAFTNKPFLKMLKSMLPIWVPFLNRSSQIKRLNLTGYQVKIANGRFQGRFLREDHNPNIGFPRNASNVPLPNNNENRVYDRITILVSNYADNGEVVTTTNLLDELHSPVTEYSFFGCSDPRPISDEDPNLLSPSRVSSIANV